MTASYGSECIGALELCLSKARDSIQFSVCNKVFVVDCMYRCTVPWNMCMYLDQEGQRSVSISKVAFVDRPLDGSLSWTSAMYKARMIQRA